MKKIFVNDKTYVLDGRTLELYELTDEDSFINLSNEEIETPFINNYEETSTLSRLTLNMSNECNLKCKYCYANGGNYHRDNAIMSKETFNKIIDDLKKRNIKSIREVKFFGGEPLLNLDLIKYGLDIFSKEFSVFKYLIVTNGILLTPDFVKTCMKYNCHFAVSLDGPEFINNFLRGNNTHSKVINNLNDCFNNEFKEKVQLLCTYTPYHLEQGYTKPDITAYFEQLGFKYIITKVGSPKEFFKFESSMEENNTFEDIDASFEYILNNTLGKTINPLVYEVLVAIGYNQKVYGFCDELNEKVNLSYDYNGDRYICYRFWGKNDYNLDNSNYKDEYDKINNKKYKNKCEDCWGRYFCTICPANVLEECMDTGFGVFDNECKKLKYYEYVLKKFCELYDNGDAQVLVDNFTNFIKES